MGVIETFQKLVQNKKPDSIWEKEVKRTSSKKWDSHSLNVLLKAILLLIERQVIVMKRKLFMCLLLLTLACSALGIDYVYYGSVVPSDPAKNLGGVALKSNGDLYYVTFDSATSILAYVANAIPGVKTSAYTVSTISTETGIPDTGRGLNDIDLDSAGNIYICGTAASGSPSILKKFNAAPVHTEVWSQSISDVRTNGIDVISNDVLAVGTNFNVLAWKKTSDGTQYAANSVAFGDMYGRSISLNTTNNDIYMGRNGNSVLDGLKVIYGGTPSNLSGYTNVLDHQLATNGAGSLYGFAMQPIDYDTNNNELIAADIYDDGLADTIQGVRIYGITFSGASTVFTQLQFFDGSTIPGRSGQYVNVFGISSNRIGGKDYLALAIGYGAPAAYAIDILVRPSAGLGDWDMY